MTLLGASPRLSTLGQHFARCIVVLLAAGALLCVGWFVLRGWRRADQTGSQTQPGKTSDSDIPGVVACVAFGAAIFGQAMVLNPSWATYNENRLSMLGLVPLIVAVGLVLVALERSHGSPLTRRATLGILGLLALASFHHLYSLIGGANSTETVALQIFAAIGAAAILYGWTKRRPALAD
jgi:hypothetical protein